MSWSQCQILPPASNLLPWQPLGKRSLSWKVVKQQALAAGLVVDPCPLDCTRQCHLTVWYYSPSLAEGMGISLWKGKGDIWDCNNRWFIALLSLLGKVLALILSRRIGNHLCSEDWSKLDSLQANPQQTVSSCFECVVRSLVLVVQNLHWSQESTQHRALWNIKDAKIIR